MANPAGGRNYAPMVRGYVADILKENRETVYRKIKEAIIEDPIKALNEIRWCLPKEMSIDIDHKVSVTTNQVTPELIRDVIEARRTLEAGDHGNVVQMDGRIPMDTPAGAAGDGIPQ